MRVRRKETLKKIEPQTKFFIGSVLLTGLYFLVMWVNQYVTFWTRVCHYMADPPTREMLVWGVISHTGKGVYCMDWILPVMIVWAGIFLILRMREMLTLVCIMGGGLLLSFGQLTRWKTVWFAVNENSLFKEDEGYGLEWKLWGIALILFFLVLPLLKEMLVCKNTGSRALLLAVSLILASGGGILISIQDFGTYSIFILARTIVLCLIAGFGLHMQKKMDEKRLQKEQPETPVNVKGKRMAEILWIILGILFVLIFTSEQCILDRDFIVSHLVFGVIQLFVGILVFLGVMLYRLFQNKSKLSEGVFRTGCLMAGIIFLYSMVLMIGSVGTDGKWGRMTKALMAGAFDFPTEKGVWALQMQVCYFPLFLTLTGVFYFLGMKKMQFLNSVMGMSCIWYFQFLMSRFGKYTNIGNRNLWAAGGMLLFFLAPLFPAIFAKAKKLPIFLFACLIFLLEASFLSILIRSWEHLSHFYSRYFSQNLFLCLLCLSLLALLMLIAMISYVKKLKQEGRQV